MGRGRPRDLGVGGGDPAGVVSLIVGEGVSPEEKRPRVRSLALRAKTQRSTKVYSRLMRKMLREIQAVLGQ